MPEKIRPVGGVDYPRTYQEFRAWFPDDVACREYLGRLRWPGGFSCPGCGCGGGWRTGRGLWMCADCGLKTSVTAGTIFHRSHTPLSTWFAAIWFVTSQKNGISAQSLQVEFRTPDGSARIGLRGGEGVEQIVQGFA